MLFIFLLRTVFSFVCLSVATFSLFLLCISLYDPNFVIYSFSFPPLPSLSRNLCRSLSHSLFSPRLSHSLFLPSPPAPAFIPPSFFSPNSTFSFSSYSLHYSLSFCSPWFSHYLSFFSTIPLTLGFVTRIRSSINSLPHLYLSPSLFIYLSFSKNSTCINKGIKCLCYFHFISLSTFVIFSYPLLRSLTLSAEYDN